MAVTANSAITPQEGPQTAFLASSADIVIFGGAAFGGKSFALLLEAARHVDDPRYNGIIFRRESPQITAGGGLWDTAGQIYPNLKGRPKESKLTYYFPSGSFIKFTHLEHENDKLKHQGAQYCFIGFDELTHFSVTQFWYILTRTRSPYGCNIAAYCRATTNPDADSWVRDLIAWWIDEQTGYAIPERSGMSRWFSVEGDNIIWVGKDWIGGDGQKPKSLTFIPSFMENNPLGMEANPEYRDNLIAQDRVTKERLVSGNWNISYKGGIFDYSWFKIVEAAPAGIKWVRYWDTAATEKKSEDHDPDWTAGALVGIRDGQLYIGDMKHFRKTPGETENEMQYTALEDGRDVPIGIEEEKGASGKFMTSHLQRITLRGYEVHPDPVSGDKVSRAKPWAAHAQHQGCYLVRGPWNRGFTAEAGSFPLGKKDQIDAVSGAWKMLTADEKLWPDYAADMLADTRIVFDKIEPGKSQLLAVLVYHKDAGIYGGCYFWGRVSKVLRVYDEFCYSSPNVDTISADVRKRLRVPLAGPDAKVFGNYATVYGSAEMFARGKIDWAALFRKKGLRLKRCVAYEEAAGIGLSRDLFKNRQIIVDPRCAKTDVQYRQWKKGIDGTPESGYPLCRALTICVSILREQKEFEDYEPLKPYGRQKNAIREKLYKDGYKGMYQLMKDGVKIERRTKTGRTRGSNDYLAT